MNETKRASARPHDVAREDELFWLISMSHYIYLATVLAILQGHFTFLFKNNFLFKNI